MSVIKKKTNKLKYCFTIVVFFPLFISAQVIEKQQNTPGSDIYVDAPYRIPKYNNGGSTGFIPIHFYFNGSNNLIYNNELTFVDIKVKNASDSVFSHLLTYNYLNDNTFNSFFMHPSVEDPLFGIQDFWESLPRKSNAHTVIFTKDTNTWLQPLPYVDINQPYFYFSFLIPGFSLTSFDDVIDIEVCLGLDWAPDEYFYLRIFRSTKSFPKIQNWYRGDVHYHAMFTQNNAENGLPLEATKMAAQLTGLDWITVTDHSCDFDNYGLSMADNWYRLGQKVEQLNNVDSTFLFIRGIELSLNNSNDNIVHALVYPCDTTPFSLPYFSDGGGDLSGTSINVDMMVDSLTKYNAFCYAAHPFSQAELLPSIINGGGWNLNDSLFPENGMPHPSVGTVVCNNTSLNSDIYQSSGNTVIKPSIVGGQIWNVWRKLRTDENPYNPWNTTYQNTAEFTLVPQNDPSDNQYRLSQNMDVFKAILRRGLLEKNQNPSINNWKFFMSAGSDAHGDFNFSNTSFLSVAGISYDYVTDNAIGKINTLVYCPNGMGLNGINILKALKNGNTLLSSGPVLTLNITEDEQLLAIPGNDTSFSQIQNCAINLEYFTNAEFGDVTKLNLIIGTQEGETILSLPYNQALMSFKLDSLLALLASVDLNSNEWFYIRAELETYKQFSSIEAPLYKRTSENFHCFTNPIWLKGVLNSSVKTISENHIRVYPNPAEDKIHIGLSNSQDVLSFNIYSSMGQLIKIIKPEGCYNFEINVSELNTGLYFLSVVLKNETYTVKFIKK
ncbi:MAG: T9SS type A sorting domain-containing protein [Bacteroidales bacterium]|nr:T9SS type A sorting domain-containing protein [Bacteroidales bacterium]